MSIFAQASYFATCIRGSHYAVTHVRNEHIQLKSPNIKSTPLQIALKGRKIALGRILS